ncbi:hypothetical protein RHGRI_029953 [Rhododendron griersonianum]|uniref:Peptidase A1 domain-containing protein n=1 Tax=Rhododendron griersonianum TaxID=479676 RepID=A0AAV6IL91_9ERIC|nr:hypothetical protein RHGRI_029953 [Rhododendron griersonianum]
MSHRRLLGVLAAAFLLTECVAAAATFSSRLVHRFSDEVKALRVSRKVMASSAPWPERRSLEYYRLLASNDLERQKMRVDSKYQLLFPSEVRDRIPSVSNLDSAKRGEALISMLHYSWIDIGTPSVSFLVALDAGSDLLWVPLLISSLNAEILFLAPCCFASPFPLVCARCLWILYYLLPAYKTPPAEEVEEPESQFFQPLPTTYFDP